MAFTERNEQVDGHEDELELGVHGCCFVEPARDSMEVEELDEPEEPQHLQPVWFWGV